LPEEVGGEVPPIFTIYYSRERYRYNKLAKTQQSFGY
jgi:hypothetical protein